MKGAIYARESSDDKEKAPPIANQIEQGKAWFAANSHELESIQQDEGYSGGARNRPGYNNILDKIKLREIEFVWVTAQDRLARDTEQILQLARICRVCNVRIYVNAMGNWMDMDSPFGVFNTTIVAAQDEMMRRLTGEKIKRAFKFLKEKAALEGKPFRWGSHSLPPDFEKKAIELFEENPSRSYRAISAMMPMYQAQEGKHKGEYVAPSHAWVGKVIRRHMRKNLAKDMLYDPDKKESIVGHPAQPGDVPPTTPPTEKIIPPEEKKGV